MNYSNIIGNNRITEDLSLRDAIYKKRNNKTISDKSLGIFRNIILKMKVDYSKHPVNQYDFKIQLESAKSEILIFRSQEVADKIYQLLDNVGDISNSDAELNNKKNHIQPENTIDDIFKMKKWNKSVSDKTVKEINKRVDLEILNKTNNEAKEKIIVIQDSLVGARFNPKPHLKIMSELNKRKEEIESKVEISSHSPMSTDEAKKPESKIIKMLSQEKLIKENIENYMHKEINMELAFLPPYEILNEILIETLKDKNIEHKKLKNIQKYISDLEKKSTAEELKSKIHLITKLIHRNGHLLDKHRLDHFLMDRLSLPIEKLLQVIRGLTP
ncbi:TPA: hypothetical protein ACS7XC_002864 [Providencia alcalifaciens]